MSTGETGSVLPLEVERTGGEGQIGGVSRRGFLAGALGVGVLGVAGLTACQWSSAGVRSPVASSTGYPEQAVSDTGSKTIRLEGIRTDRQSILHAGKAEDDKTVWLTFDDAGDHGTVRGIIDILAEEEIQGVFFPLGEFACANPSLIRAMKQGGHIVGNHSYDHPVVTVKNLEDQVQRAERYIEPNSDPKLFRFPGGRNAFDRRTVEKLRDELGYQSCGWTVDTRDWDNLPPEEIVRRVRDGAPGAQGTPRVQERGVVLMHMNGEHTLEALPGVIAVVRARGLTMPSLR